MRKNACLSCTAHGPCFVVRQRYRRKKGSNCCCDEEIGSEKKNRSVREILIIAASPSKAQYSLVLFAQFIIVRGDFFSVPIRTENILPAIRISLQGLISPSQGAALASILCARVPSF